MKRTALCIALAAFSFAANAQITVLENGKAYFGDMPTSINLNEHPNDPDNDVQLQVFGSGYGGSKGMICFGDYGRSKKDGRNVVVGEYGKSFEGKASDTDQLWLHGKDGIYLTKQRGAEDSDIIGYYDTQKGNNFYFKCPIYSQGSKITSDARLKSDIKPIENSLNNLMRLNGVSYYLNSKPSVSENGLKSTKVYDKKTIGVLAQELMKVYPELVDKDADGFYAVDYIGLIPVLIESIKEQQAQIEQLSEKLENVENGNTNSVINDILSTKATLKQNTPNPFKEQTVIEYSVPENAVNASVIVYDMTGAQLKEYKLMAKGNSSVTIKGSEFKAGMYIYSLIVDGKLVDTKRMILTK